MKATYLEAIFHTVKRLAITQSGALLIDRAIRMSCCHVESTYGTRILTSFSMSIQRPWWMTLPGSIHLDNDILHSDPEGKRIAKPFN